jgi:hypothetical protein
MPPGKCQSWSVTQPANPPDPAAKASLSACSVRRFRFHQEPRPETISGVVAAVNQWTATETGPWQVSEVNFGLTVGAEGKLLFIAGASAQASVEVKLTRRGR